MGLDMKLNARISLYKHNDVQDEIIQFIKGKQTYIPVSMEPRYIIFEVMRWRKAYGIHQWFVDNVQDGEDYCPGPYPVDKRQLMDLLELCKEAQIRREDGYELFGTDVINDEKYYSDLDYTIKVLRHLLSNQNNHYIVGYEYESNI